MKKLVLPLVMLVAGFCPAQNKQVNPAIASFVPQGYSVLDTAHADINLDSIDDLIVILKNDSETILQDYSRPLLLLTGNANGNYELAARNDSVVLCQGCGGVFGDPYAGITVSDGYFEINHYGGSAWRWTRNICFRYDVKRKNWMLVDDSGVSYNINDSDENGEVPESENKFGHDYGNISFEQFNCYE